MKRALGLALLSLFFVVGCGSNSGTNPTPPPVTGDKVQLVLFGAPWCVNCRKELTELNSSFKSFDRASRVSTLVYVTSGDNPSIKATDAIAAKYKSDLGLIFATQKDPKCGNYVRLIGDTSCILPAAVILDKDGKTLKLFTDSYTAEDVMAELRARLK